MTTCCKSDLPLEIQAKVIQRSWLQKLLRLWRSIHKTPISVECLAFEVRESVRDKPKANIVLI